MTTQELIQQEAYRIYPVRNETVIVAGQTITHDDNFVPREMWKQAATFGASLRGAEISELKKEIERLTTIIHINSIIS